MYRYILMSMLCVILNEIHIYTYIIKPVALVRCRQRITNANSHTGILFQLRFYALNLIIVCLLFDISNTCDVFICDRTKNSGNFKVSGALLLHRPPMDIVVLLVLRSVILGFFITDYKIYLLLISLLRSTYSNTQAVMKGALVFSA